MLVASHYFCTGTAKAVGFHLQLMFYLDDFHPNSVWNAARSLTVNEDAHHSLEARYRVAQDDGAGSRAGIRLVAASQVAAPVGGLGIPVPIRQGGRRRSGRRCRRNRARLALRSHSRIGW